MSLGRFLERSRSTGGELARLRKLAEKPKKLTQDQRRKLSRFPSLFRQVCQNLALARHRDYSTRVVTQLNRAALESHQQMYGGRSGLFSLGVRFITETFPRAFRAEPWIAFWAFALLFGPLPILTWMIQDQPELAYSILGPEAIRQMESMYANDTGVINVERPADSDAMMFGLYIYNNISIAFYTFAGGVFFGLLSIFFLAFNGVYMGAIFGHLHRIGAGENLYTFVIAHGSFELTAIAIAGMAGLVLGRSLYAPGQYTRLHAFQRAGRQSVVLVGGAAGMLLIAAFIEAFWSPRVLPAEVKYAVGGTLWVLVIVYFAFAGRRRRGS